jgi:hypothetical protein
VTDTTTRPFIDLGGVRYPLDAAGVRPQLNYSPTQAFPDAITFGRADVLIDQRTRALVYTDHRGGMGEYQAPNGQLAAQQSFTISDCDTRFERSLVLPPNPVQLGPGAALGSSTKPWYIEYLGESNAKLLAWQFGGGAPLTYNPGTNAWVAAGSLAGSSIPADATKGGMSAVTYYKNRLVAVYNGGLGSTQSLSYSPDNGVTWIQNTAATAKLYNGGVECNGLFWTYDALNYALRWTADVTADPATTAWAMSSLLFMRPHEQVVQLVQWKNPRNEPAVFILTNQRLIRFDQDLDTPATPGFFTIHDFGGRVATTCIPRAYVWPRDQQLYVTLGDPSASTGPVDSVLQFGPASSSEVGPNVRGGIPAGETFSIGSLIGSYHWLYGFGLPRAGTSNPGRVLAMNGLQGWHSLAKGNFNGIGGAIGGGYANGLVWFVTTTGYVYEMKDPDVPDLPANLQSGTRAYPPGTFYYHDTGWHGGGLENIRKIAQYLALDARYNNGTIADAPGVPTSTQVSYAYQTDTSGGWVTLGTYASGTAFPTVAAINSALGAKCKRFRLRIGLYTSDGTKTPNIAGFEINFIPKPREHYAYIARLDLTEGGPNFPTPESTFGPYTSQQLQSFLLAAADGDTLLQVNWGGDDPTDANYTSLPAAQIKLGGSQDSDSSSGKVTCTIIDLSPPPSGV